MWERHKKSFERAYRYLKSAKCLYDDIEEINILTLREEKAKNLTLSLIDEIFSGKERHNNKSNERCLFASAITPDGLINYIPSLLNNIEKVYVIKSECAMPVDQVLERVRREALEMGCDVELFYCAFNPKKLEHVIIPKISTAVLTSNEFHTVDVNTCKEIDFREYENISIHKMYEDVLNFDNAKFNSLLNQAVKTISQAKKIHDRLEEFYIPHMNFEEMQKNYDNTVQKILKCIGT